MNILSSLIEFKNNSISLEELQQKMKKFKKKYLKEIELSKGQKGLWAIDKMNKSEFSGYNVPFAFYCSKELDIEQFEKAVHLLLLDFPILNSYIHLDNYTPVLKIKSKLTPFFRYYEQNNSSKQTVLDQVKAISRKRINLDGKDLSKFYVFECDDQYIILINIHHIIFDGTSIFKLLSVLFDRYTGLVENSKFKVTINDVDYESYISHEKEKSTGEIGRVLSNYWIDELRGYTNTCGSLFNDSPYTKQKSKDSVIDLSQEFSDKIDIFCKNNELNRAAFFLGVYRFVLADQLNIEDLVIGIPIQKRSLSEYDDSIGYFINMVPIRQKVNYSDDFKDFFRQTKNKLFQSIENSDYPFMDIINNVRREKIISENSNDELVYFNFSYQNYIRKDSFDKMDFMREFSVEFLDEIHQEGEYKLTLEIFETKTGYKVRLKYLENYFTAKFINSFQKAFSFVIQNILGQEDKQTLLLEHIRFPKNEEDENIQECESLYELIKFASQKYPLDVAVSDQNKSITYQEIIQEVDLYAEKLSSVGISTGDIVGVHLGKSINLVVILLSILKLKACFVPLDPTLPHKRLKYIIENSNPVIVLCDKDTIQNDLVLYDDTVSIEISEIDKEYTKIKKVSSELNSQHPAYILYTSGSTGNPKGVMVSEKALVNFLISMREEPGITSSDRLLSVTSFGFDIAFLEMFLPLIVGAETVLIDATISRNPKKLKAIIKKVRPSIMQATPTTWHMLFQVKWKNDENVKALCGGELLTEKLINLFMNSETELWNMFGPTETTVWSSIKKIEKNTAITIGKPILNTEFFVFDENMNKLGVGEKGELYIAGKGLAEGYYKNEELTKERFINNPYYKGGKIYKTGDLVKLNEYEEYEYLGRVDNQIKINGYRIELEEIESVAESFESVSKCIVVINGEENNKQMIAGIIPTDSHSFDSQKFINFIAEKLPKYMVPAKIQLVEQFPLNSNGKIDRKEFLEIIKNSNIVSTNESQQRSFTDLKGITSKMKEIVKRILNIDLVDENEGFFELGIDSLRTVILIEQLNKIYPCKLTTTDIFEYTNIFELSKYIEQKLAKDNLSSNSEDDFVVQTNQEKHSQALSDNDVAIIGISCSIPGAAEQFSLWRNLKDHIDSIQFTPSEELDQLKNEKVKNDKNFVPTRAVIENKYAFDPSFFNMSPKQAEIMNPQTRQLLMHSWNAFEDAGYNPKMISNSAVYTSTSDNNYLNKPNKKIVVNDTQLYSNWLYKQPGTTATLISYHLGLNGPSASVHSNCSSSLLGVKLAVRDISVGEVDYALVGASSINSFDSVGYMYQKGMNFSKSGKIRAFDDLADGMVGGEGVVTILLKNAKKAIKDRDNIYAIIKGVAINNDGKEKAGFFAPSVSGQVKVIKAAIEDAKLKPKDINFIEAHGTGTNLGDPIEFKALQQVFTMENMGEKTCGIGSIKSSLGHLDTAAGLIGIVKSALSIKRKMLPATINFKNINSKIDINNSPLYVVTENVDLTKSSLPVRIGVSSFGIGGTNGHVILEEHRSAERLPFKQTNDILSDDNIHAIPLSARTPAALIENCKQLLKFCESYSLNIEDVAFTTKMSRSLMECRTLFLAQNMEELVRKLESLHESDASEVNEIVRDEKTAELICNWLKGESIDWQDVQMNECKTGKRISLPTYSFETQEFFLREESMNLMENEKSEMIHPFIEKNESMFESIKFSKTLTGNEYYIKDHVINHKKILPAVFYIEMSLVASKLALGQKILGLENLVWSDVVVVDKTKKIEIELQKKEDLVSFTIIDQQVSSSQQKMQGKVLTEYLEINKRLNIEQIKNKCTNVVEKNQIYHKDAMGEYDYGSTYQSIEKIFYSYPVVSLAQVALPEHCKKNYDQFDIHPAILEGSLQSIIGLLNQENKIMFVPYAIEKIMFVKSPPMTCFAKAIPSTEYENLSDKIKKFNIDICDLEGNVCISIKNYTIRLLKQPKEEHKYSVQQYCTQWSKKTLRVEEVVSRKNMIKITPKFSLNNQMNSMVEDIITSFNRLSTNSDEESMRIGVFLPKLNEDFVNDDMAIEISNFIFHLCKAVTKNSFKKKKEMIFFYQSDKDSFSAYYRSLKAICRSLKQEYPYLKFKTVELTDNNFYLTEDKLYQEFLDFSATHVLLDGDERYIEVMAKQEYTPSSVLNAPIKEGGIYIVAGGLGNIGKILTHDLLNNFNSSVVILGRKDVSKKELAQEFSEKANQVFYFSTDVCQKIKLARTFEKIKQEIGNPNGIFFCCGEINDSLFENKNWDMFKKTIEPKVSGVINLDKVTKNLDLDTFVIFSSISTIGNMGQCDYAFANEFLNSYLIYRNKLVKDKRRSGKTISINWPLWNDGKMKPSDQQTEFLQNTVGMLPLMSDDALKILLYAMNEKDDTSYFIFGDQSKTDKYLKEKFK